MMRFCLSKFCFLYFAVEKAEYNIFLHLSFSFLLQRRLGEGFVLHIGFRGGLVEQFFVFCLRGGLVKQFFIFALEEAWYRKFSFLL